MVLANKQFKKRKDRVRRNLRKNNISSRVRLSVFRSNYNIYVQLIDDYKGVTLASASTLDKELAKKLKGKTSSVNAAREVGIKIAEKAKELKIKEVVFDKGAYKYHGKVKALADGAREAKFLVF